MSGPPMSPARLAAMMAAFELGLPEEAIASFAESCEIDLDRFGMERSHSQVIDRHNQQLRRRLQECDTHAFTIRTSMCYDTKPKAWPAAFSTLTPISCADLKLQTTHRGRVLKGKLVVDANVMVGIYTVLEDEKGDVVQVALYNTPEMGHVSNQSFKHCLRTAQRLFPQGQGIAIMEPYYKVMSDGTTGIRVDDPSEVVFLDTLEQSVASLEQQGNKHLAAHQYQEAVDSFTKALSRLQQQGEQQAADTHVAQLQLSVLLNLSAAHLQLQRPLHALLYASAAAVVSCHKSSKAYYRAAVALDAMLDAASCICGNSAVIAAATGLMDQAVKLQGHNTHAARQQMLAALKACAAAASTSTGKQGKKAQHKTGGSSSSKVLSSVEEWQVVCQVLAGCAMQLSDCFTGCTLDSSSSSSRVAVQAANMAKDAGNTCFKQGSYVTALHHYQMAFDALKSNPDTRTPALLVSRSTAWLAQPSKHSQQQAVLDALAGVLLLPGQELGFSTAATALLQLEDMKGALAVCELGLQQLPGSSKLVDLKQQIQAAAAAAAAPPDGDDDESGDDDHEDGVAMKAPAATALLHRALDGDSKGSGSKTNAQSAPSSKSAKKKGKKSKLSSSAGSSSSSAAAAHGTRRGTPGGTTEREAEEMINGDCLQVEQVALFNQLAGMAARLGRGGRGGQGGRSSGRGEDTLLEYVRLDERTPKLHEEFSKAGRWPPQIDIDWAQRQLWEGYELARALPMQMLGVIKSEPRPEDMLKRLGTLDRERFMWLCMADPGDVSFPTFRPPYGGDWQSFSNCPARPGLLTPGTNHVAIGFVDLGGLAASCEIMDQQHTGSAHLPEAGTSTGGPSSSNDGSTNIKPLRWVGYEMSAPCVAKTLVLLQMIQQASTVQEVMQVWYSSTWSSNTLAAFKSAVLALLNAGAAASQRPLHLRTGVHPSADALADPDVLELLQHWQVTNVSLAAAREGWAQAACKSTTVIANFKRKVDRLAMCQLLLTGDMPTLGGCDHGSICMFAVPDKFGERALDECFLQSLPFESLMKAWCRQPSLDVITVALELLQTRTSALINKLRGGMVKAEVHRGAVQPGATRITSSIHALQPHTISWSNVPDYMDPRSFHRLAQSISAPSDTVHFMDSMNWPMYVKGACHVDMTVSLPQQALEQVMRELKEKGNVAVAMVYTLLGVQDLLLVPPAANPRKIIDFGLYIMWYKEYVDAFFASGLSSMPDPKRQVLVVAPPTFSLVSRTDSTLHIAFSYDEAIRLCRWGPPDSPAST